MVPSTSVCICRRGTHGSAAPSCMLRSIAEGLRTPCLAHSYTFIVCFAFASNELPRSQPSNYCRYSLAMSLCYCCHPPVVVKSCSSCTNMYAPRGSELWNVSPLYYVLRYDAVGFTYRSSSLACRIKPLFIKVRCRTSEYKLRTRIVSLHIHPYKHTEVPNKSIKSQ